MKQNYTSGFTPSRTAAGHRTAARTAKTLKQQLLITLLLFAFLGGARAQDCSTPTNLTQSDVTMTSATLSWEGESDNYMLQYRPWYQVGNDVIATGKMTTYTYDLSAYSGTGSVAIRHYDCTNMFKLIVDDIVVKNAAGAVVFSENFENSGGNIPSSFTNMDLDGDGDVWAMVENPPSACNGTYGISSASYRNFYGALTPDNWLIISDIELGGSISFNARGQDRDYPSENFAVYVSTETSMVEVQLTASTYTATGLEPNTPYAWEVKGVCGSNDSQFASSFFKTQDDLLVFATDGNWNELSNWTDVEGNAINDLPTTDYRVRIEADATIPADVIAYAGKTTINGGSITIKDGGQLKHMAATLDVTMEKDIVGYGNGGAYHLFGSPFSGRTKLEYDAGWSNLTGATTGAYDLYAFDATAANEWINYEKSPSHISFQGEDNGNPGLLYGEGYLYANEENTTLTFTGTTSLSCNNTFTTDLTYNANSTNEYNGWKLVGNPYTCNGYLMFGDAEGNMMEATFYKMNAAGNGYVKYENYVMLAPGEGAFVKYHASGKVWYFSDDQGWTIESSGTESIPVLPKHGKTTNQDASVDLELTNDAPNNSELINAADGTEKNVLLSGRTLFKDTNWNTICLPFDVTLDDSPLAGATAKTLTNATVSGTHVSLTFGNPDSETEPITVLKAGTPYIIKWERGDDIVNPAFTGVTINASTPIDYPTGDNANENVKFIGYYDAFTITSANDDIYYMTADKTLKHTGKTRVLKTCRAYFQFSNTAKARDLILDFGEGNGTTGISEKGIVKSEESAPATWYTVDGKKLDGAPTRKGVYIYNGDKVVIK